MRARRSIVHVCVGDGSVAHSLLEDLHGLLSRRDILLCDILNVDAFGLVLPDFEIVFASVKQIPDLLHVYLDHAHLDSELQIIGTVSYCLEDRVNTAR
jgi:hypothetical protein